jgi:peptidoglycan hydrolase CwlO-like protein
LFNIILNVYVHFQIQKLENKLTLVEKELQRAREDNTALARYINTRIKKEEARKKTDEEAQRKAMVVAPRSDEGQRFKNVWTWRKQSFKDSLRHLPPPAS